MKNTMKVGLVGLIFLAATRLGARPDEDRKSPAEAKTAAFAQKIKGSYRKGLDPATGAAIFEIAFPSGEKLDEKTFAELPSLSGLQSVDLTGVEFVHPPWEVLARCKDLRCLNLSSTINTEKGFAEIEKLKDLEELDLSNTSLGDASLARVGKLVNLVRLNLYNSPRGKGAGGRPSDRSLAFLPSLKKLQILDLSYLPITDAGVALLAKLPALEAVDVSHAYGITDKSLPVFRNLLKLKYVRLQPTGISGKGLAELMAARPEVRFGL